MTMREDRFWNLVEAARQESGGDCESHAAVLQRQVQTLPIEEIVAFHKIFIELRHRAYRQDLWAAAYIVGSYSDDDFSDFRSWLIGQGREAYYNALRDPGTVVDLDLRPDGGSQCQPLLNAAEFAYEARTGAEMPMREYQHSELVGEDWEEEDLPGMYPELWARYGESDEDETVDAVSKEV